MVITKTGPPRGCKHSISQGRPWSLRPKSLLGQVSSSGPSPGPWLGCMFQLPCSSWPVRVDKWGRRPDPALSPQSGQLWPLPPRAECWEPLGLGGQAVPRTCEAGQPVHISTSPGTSSQFLTKPRFPFCAVPSWGDIWRGHYQEFRGVTNPKSGQLERPGGVMDIRGAGRLASHTL